MRNQVWGPKNILRNFEYQRGRQPAAPPGPRPLDPSLSAEKQELSSPLLFLFSSRQQAPPQGNPYFWSFPAAHRERIFPDFSSSWQPWAGAHGSPISLLSLTAIISPAPLIAISLTISAFHRLLLPCPLPNGYSPHFQLLLPLGSSRTCLHLPHAISFSLSHTPDRNQSSPSPLSQPLPPTESSAPASTKPHSSSRSPSLPPHLTLSLSANKPLPSAKQTKTKLSLALPWSRASSFPHLPFPTHGQAGHYSSNNPSSPPKTETGHSPCSSTVSLQQSSSQRRRLQLLPHSSCRSVLSSPAQPQ